MEVDIQELEAYDLVVDNRRRLEIDVIDIEDAEVAEGYAQIASAITKAQSKETKEILILNIKQKLKIEDEYSICGTYSNTTPNLWFYCTTSVCPGDNHLLNLFVIHRQVGCFKIGVSDSNEIVEKKGEKLSCLSSNLKYYFFKTSQPNEHHFVKTFCFSTSHLTIMENILLIPITIDIDCQLMLDSDILKRIKNSHNFNELLSKSETTDFTIETRSGKQFNVHRIVLAMHSPQLRSMLKSNTKHIVLDIHDDDVDFLLEFLYTGIVKDIQNHDLAQILRIAEQFQLDNLFVLAEHAINLQLNVDNAVEFALLSDKYKLDKMQDTVFDFIKNNPAVVKSDGWKKLEDSITKKLTQWMFMAKSVD